MFMPASQSTRLPDTSSMTCLSRGFRPIGSGHSSRTSPARLFGFDFGLLEFLEKIVWGCLLRWDSNLKAIARSEDRGGLQLGASGFRVSVSCLCMFPNEVSEPGCTPDLPGRLSSTLGRTVTTYVTGLCCKVPTNSSTGLPARSLRH